MDYMPNEDEQDDMPFAGVRGIPAIFLGRKLNPGSVWNREYRFARLDDFTSYSLANDTRRVGVPVRTARTFWYEPGHSTG